MSRPIKLLKTCICPICKISFFAWPYELKRGKKYCSKKCFNKNKYKHKTIDKRGYILIYKPEHPFAKSTGYVYEHRLVMEKYLGRYLKPEEHIHHKDGNPSNNNILNLVLTNQKEHNAKFHPNNGIKSRFTTERMIAYWKQKKKKRDKDLPFALS